MKDRITVTFSLNLADAAQWQKVGGAKWLRKKLRGMRCIGVEKKLRDKAMREAYASGQSILAIAASFNVHKSTVRRALKG
jgi:DNA invertase Pin-like site-specific DNA recombinase